MEDKDEVQLYTMYNDDKVMGYAYGKSWIAQALMMDDIRYDTPEEAKKAWEDKWSKL